MPSEQTYTIGGEAKTLSPLTQGMKTSYSNWVSTRFREATIDTEMALQRRARKIRQILIEDSKAMAMEVGRPSSLSDEQRQDLEGDLNYLVEAAARQTKELNEAKTTGRLHFSGDMCISTMASVEGTVRLLHMLLVPKHPETNLEKAFEMYDKHQNAWISAIREVTGLGKNALPFGSEKKNEDDTEEIQ